MNKKKRRMSRTTAKSNDGETSTTSLTRDSSSWDRFISWKLFVICGVFLSMNIIWQWIRLETNITWTSIPADSDQPILPSSSLSSFNTTTMSSDASDIPTSGSDVVTSIAATRDTTTPSIVIDIMSIASKDRQDYLSAQRETFGQHSSVRNFYNVTEIDDLAWPNCSTSMTKDDAIQYIQTCRSKHSTSTFLQQYKFFPQRWILRKPNPIGWLCAQVRPGSALGKLGRIYSENNLDTQEQLLPDYLWLIDDDTLLRMDLFVEEMRHVDPSIPMVWAGCLTVLDHPPNKNARYKRYSPFGGAGTVWSKGALMRLMERIDCNTTHTEDDDSSTSIFVKQICNRIQDNLILERDLFVNGMTVFEFIQKVFHTYPNCFHSDWLLGHFIDYYYLSEESVEQPAHRQIKNKQRLHALTNESLQIFYNDSAPVGNICVATSVAKQTSETCSKAKMICHYVKPDMMKEFIELGES